MTAHAQAQPTGAPPVHEPPVHELEPPPPAPLPIASQPRAALQPPDDDEAPKMSLPADLLPIVLRYWWGGQPSVEDEEATVSA